MARTPQVIRGQTTAGPSASRALDLGGCTILCHVETDVVFGVEGALVGPIPVDVTSAYQRVFVAADVSGAGADHGDSGVRPVYIDLYTAAAGSISKITVIDPYYFTSSVNPQEGRATGCLTGAVDLPQGHHDIYLRLQSDGFAPNGVARIATLQVILGQAVDVPGCLVGPVFQYDTWRLGAVMDATFFSPIIDGSASYQYVLERDAELTKFTVKRSGGDGRYRGELQRNQGLGWQVIAAIDTPFWIDDENEYTSIDAVASMNPGDHLRFVYHHLSGEPLNIEMYATFDGPGDDYTLRWGEGVIGPIVDTWTVTFQNPTPTYSVHSAQYTFPVGGGKITQIAWTGAAGPGGMGPTDYHPRLQTYLDAFDFTGAGWFEGFRLDSDSYVYDFANWEFETNGLIRMHIDLASVSPSFSLTFTVVSATPNSGTDTVISTWFENPPPEDP